MAQTQQSGWRRSFQVVHDKVFVGLDALGAQVNKASGKLGMEGFWPGPMEGEIKKASRILTTFTSDEMLDVAVPTSPTSPTTPDAKKKTQKVLVKIPPSLIRNAQGLAIFTAFRTGLGFSGAGGSGVVLSRDSEGNWGPPSGLLIHTIGFGFLAGADVYDVVLILRTRKAVKAFSNPKVSLGAEVSVAAGPLGAGAVLDSGIEASPVLSYVKSKGLYGGAQVDGNIILERKDENARFYGRPIKASEILAEDSRVECPPGTEVLHIAIAAAEGVFSGSERRENELAMEDVRRSISISRTMSATGGASGSQSPMSPSWMSKEKEAAVQEERFGSRNNSLDEDETEEIQLHDDTEEPAPSYNTATSMTPARTSFEMAPPPRRSVPPPPAIPPRRSMPPPPRSPTKPVETGDGAAVEHTS